MKMKQPHKHVWEVNNNGVPMRQRSRGRQDWQLQDTQCLTVNQSHGTSKTQPKRISRRYANRLIFVFSRLLEDPDFSKGRMGRLPMSDNTETLQLGRSDAQ